jgi:PST family polysaccharide transporter
LARLLTPADFGLIAMVTVITGFVEMFKDAGLSMATIQCH